MGTSSNWHTELAKMFKVNENKEYIGIIVGTVVGVNPLKISIYGGQAFITEENMYICKNATEYSMQVSTGGTVIHEGLKVNDRAAIIATEDNQKFFVIDKVV
jgi:hypothetical protein